MTDGPSAVVRARLPAVPQQPGDTGARPVVFGYVIVRGDPVS